MKKVINSQNVPKAIGPYSQAILAGDFIYVSGQLPIDGSTGLMPQTIKEQTKQSLDNIKYILLEEGLNMSNIVKTTVLLSDMSYFGEMNEIYASYFEGDYPARSCFAVKELPKQALVEIECIAKR